MAKYFDKFPLVEYSGSLARNILLKVDFTKESKADIYANFDYTLTTNLKRPDLLSQANYDSPHYDWLIYLANDVIDPYHDWSMTDIDFDRYIDGKYGSRENALKQILYYRNNWSPDESIIPDSLYASMPHAIQKYYTNTVGGYKRKEEDWIRSTNKIVSRETTIPDDLKIGDLFESGTVVSIDHETSTILLNHITGPQEGFVLIENIPDTEASFWAAVTAYDWEEENNKVKNNINMIKKSYLPKIEKDFNESL